MQEFDKANIHPTAQQNLFFGRPDLESIFEQTSELCLREHLARVAVFICAPTEMVNDTADLCKKFSKCNGCSGDYVQFDLHKEIFYL